jgi:hypothetical protein
MSTKKEIIMWDFLVWVFNAGLILPFILGFLVTFILLEDIKLKSRLFENVRNSYWQRHEKINFPFILDYIDYHRWSARWMLVVSAANVGIVVYGMCIDVKLYLNLIIVVWFLVTSVLHESTYLRYKGEYIEWKSLKHGGKYYGTKLQ